MIRPCRSICAGKGPASCRLRSISAIGSRTAGAETTHETCSPIALKPLRSSRKRPSHTRITRTACPPFSPRSSSRCNRKGPDGTVIAPVCAMADIGRPEAAMAAAMPSCPRNARLLPVVIPPPPHSTRACPGSRAVAPASARDFLVIANGSHERKRCALALRLSGAPTQNMRAPGKAGDQKRTHDLVRHGNP